MDPQQADTPVGLVSERFDGDDVRARAGEGQVRYRDYDLERLLLTWPQEFINADTRPRYLGYRDIAGGRHEWCVRDL